MAKKDKKRRLNIHFRQTVREFKSARQAQIYSHLNRNLPYKIFKVSKTQFLNKVKQINIMKNKRLDLLGKHPYKTKKEKSSASPQKLLSPKK